MSKATLAARTRTTNKGTGAARRPVKPAAPAAPAAPATAEDDVWEGPFNTRLGEVLLRLKLAANDLFALLDGGAMPEEIAECYPRMVERLAALASTTHDQLDMIGLDRQQTDDERRRWFANKRVFGGEGIAKDAAAIDATTAADPAS